MAVEIRPVGSRRELDAFIKLPWRLYRNEPNWVAPLLMGVAYRLVGMFTLTEDRLHASWA